MIIAATGHRPQDIIEDHGIVELKARVKLQSKATRLICGMASGFDLLAARAAMSIDLPITAVRPYLGHGHDDTWQPLYEEVLAYADKTRVLYDQWKFPGNNCYHERNRWMVDHADAVMAYWNGKESGGTFQTRKYAKEVGKPVANIIDDPPF